MQIAIDCAVHIEAITDALMENLQRTKSPDFLAEGLLPRLAQLNFLIVEALQEPDASEERLLSDLFGKAGAQARAEVLTS